MIENPARVMRVSSDVAWVRSESPTSCGACGGKGCGNSLYARMLHPREPEYPVLNPIGAEVGEAVVVGIEDGAVFRAALSGYIVPLLLLLAGAVLGSVWGELQSVSGGLAGLLIAAFWLKRRRTDSVPVILRRGEAHCSAH
jgi:sigma-E factor negative regulatory protein RseC